MNRSSLTLAEINKIARYNYFGKRKKDYGNADANLVMSTSAGPFWFRGIINIRIWGVDENFVDSVL